MEATQITEESGKQEHPIIDMLCIHVPTQYIYFIIYLIC